MSAPASPQGPLFSLRTAVLLLAALISGTTVGVLTYLVTPNISATLLAGGATFVGTIDRLNKWIGS